VSYTQLMSYQKKNLSDPILHFIFTKVGPHFRVTAYLLPNYIFVYHLPVSTYARHPRDKHKLNINTICSHFVPSFRYDG